MKSIIQKASDHYIGLGWLDGRLPYIDVWDMKPPGIFALNAAVFAIFPNSFGALAIVEGFFIVACALTIYALLRQWRASRGGGRSGHAYFRHHIKFAVLQRPRQSHRDLCAF